MTQKELLYLEDAIGHEKNIIDICTDSMDYLENETLVKFIESEVKKHESNLDKLMKLLKGCAK